MGCRHRVRDRRVVGRLHPRGELADVAALVRRVPVEAVLCNGKTAYSLLLRTGMPPVRTVCMPSTSPANPRFSQAAWQEELLRIFGERT